MRSTTPDMLPPKLRRTLATLGEDIRNARRKRGLTVAMMLERVGVAKGTYLKIEKGDPSVSMGAYAMTLFALGFPDALSDIADSQSDETGLLPDAERLTHLVRETRSEGHTTELPS